MSQGQALEFIIAVPGRRYTEFADLSEDFQRTCDQCGTETTGEIAWNGLRLVVAHDPVVALEQRQKRRAKMAELEALASGRVGKLEGQDGGVKKRGSKLSDSGTKARFYRAVCEAHFANIIKVDLKAELFSYAIDEDALRLAEMMDGRLLVVTNVQDLEPACSRSRTGAWAPSPVNCRCATSPCGRCSSRRTSDPRRSPRAPTTCLQMWLQDVHSLCPSGLRGWKATCCSALTSRPCRWRQSTDWSTTRPFWR